MESAADISRYTDNLLMKMLMMDPGCPLHIHVVDSDQMGIDKIPKIIEEEPDSTPVIGVTSARIRHKIAFQHELPITSFSFITESGSDLWTTDPEGKHLILWSYLDLVQPLAEQIVHRGWSRVDLIVIFRQLVTPTGKPNLSLASLVHP